MPLKYLGRRMIAFQYHDIQRRLQVMSGLYIVLSSEKEEGGGGGLFGYAEDLVLF